MSNIAITSGQNFNFTLGQYSSFLIDYTGSPTIWTAVGLPLGISINQSGNVYGTPTVVGGRSSYITAKDSGSNFASSLIGFSVSNPSGVSNQLLISPLSGYSNITPFQFNFSTTTSLSSSYILWNFGDGGTSNQISPLHIYYTPGNYTVTLNIYSETQNISLSSTVNVKLLLNESVYFSFVPPPAFAGHLNRYPFNLTFTSSVSGPHYIDLSSQYSRSYKAQNPKNKWSFLRPEWRFLDLNLNPISTIIPSETPIYTDEFGNYTTQANGLFAGVTGIASFYFVDDIYNFDLEFNNQPYTTLIATLRTDEIKSFNDGFNTDNSLPGYANSLATASCPYRVLWRTPDTLFIKENGVRDYINPRWPSATQPVIVNTNFNVPYTDNWVDGNGASTLWSNESFCHNIPINSYTPLPLTLNSVGFSASFYPTPPNFQWIDNTGYKTPGYYKGSFTTNVSAANNVSLSANLNFVVPILSAQYSNPTLWISNPTFGTLTNVQYVYNPKLSASENTNNLNIAQLYSFNTNSNGISSIASLPSPTYHAWTLDSKNNYLYRMNTAGQILTSVNINSYFAGNSSIYANSLAIDGYQNVWVTLYNTASTLKFDQYGNYMINIKPNISSLVPICVDTDTNNNVWVGYNNTSSGTGYFVKYSNSGLQTQTIAVSSLASGYKKIQSMVVDKNNNVCAIINNGSLWFAVVANIGKVYSGAGGSVANAKQIAVDLNQNIWFVWGNHYVMFINRSNDNVDYLDINNFAPSDTQCSLNGIGCDNKGNVFVLDSATNQIFVINYNRQVVNSFYVNPQGYAQANGDWTGFNWYNKYANLIPQYTNTTTSVTITGKSIPLNFVDFTKSDIFTINENFDLAANMQSLAFTPTLIESEFLFNNFLGSIYGKYPFKHNDIGVTLYEKIANYVSNISDIDYCNIRELYNLSYMVGLDIQDFDLNYPSEIGRVIDFASINLSKLVGARSLEQTSFTTPNSQGKYNMNPTPISSLSYMVTAGIPLVLKDRSLNQYRLVNTGYINCSAIYTLKDFANSIGFTSPNWPSYYEFHQFIPNFDGKQVAGFIDWNNPQTTVNESLSSYNDWYGTGNYLDAQFSYELYNGLGLLN